MGWGQDAEPYWWRGRRPGLERVPSSSDTLVLTGSVEAVNLDDAPLSRSVMLRSLSFEHAEVRGVDLQLDEVRLSVMWSEFEDCTFRQRSRRLHRDGLEPQGSFGNRPSVYRRCRFEGLRMRTRAGFSVMEARFEECSFVRCRFTEHFSFEADYVNCMFEGPMQTAVFYGTVPERFEHAGRRNEIVGNDFSRVSFSDGIAWRGDVDIDAQIWPPEYVPVRDA